MVLLYCLLAVWGISFGDRGWYEPDGVAILAGSVNLAQAKAGEFFLYNYYYQPLAYEVNYLVYRISSLPYFLYLLPALLGALAVCLLTFSVYQASNRRINLFFSFCFLLLFPEIFFRLLYPNSSVFGMVIFSLAVLILFWKNSPQAIVSSKNTKYFLAGSLAVLACFFRFDFLLGIPALFFIIIFKARSRRSIIAFSLGSFFILAAAIFSGIFKPLQILAYYKSHFLLNGSLAESQINSLNILFTATNIAVWFFLSIYACVYFGESLAKKDFKRLLVIIPAGILFYPVFGRLVSGHHLLAAICLGPFVLLAAILDFSQRPLAKRLKLNFKRSVYTVVIFSILVQFFSLEPEGKFPYLRITRNPAYAHTHDGPRFFGAYWKGYQQVSSSNQKPYWQDALAFSQGLAELVSNSESDFVIVGLKEAVLENYLLSVNTYSLAFFLQVKGYKLKISPQGFILTGKKNKVFIQSLSLPEYQSFSQKTLSKPVKSIKLPLISRWQVIFENPLKAYWAQFLRL